MILAVLPTFGCGRQPRAVAADGAAPGVAVDIPVGPIPGLSQQPALMTNPYAETRVEIATYGYPTIGRLANTGMTMDIIPVAGRKMTYTQG